MKVSANDGKTSNQTTMGKRLERFGEVEIVDETNGFELEFMGKRKWILEHHPRRGSDALRSMDLGLVFI